MTKKNLTALFSLTTAAGLVACTPKRFEGVFAVDEITASVGETFETQAYIDSDFDHTVEVSFVGGELLDVSPQETTLTLEHSVTASVDVSARCPDLPGDYEMGVIGRSSHGDNKYMDGDFLRVHCVSSDGTGAGGTGGGGAGGAGGSSSSTGGGGTGGVADDPTDDCLNGVCQPEMDIVSADIDCTSGYALATLQFAGPMPATANDESGRSATFYTANHADKYELRATAFASTYTCGLTHNDAFMTLPATATCEVQNGAFVFGLAESSVAGPLVEVEFQSDYYDGMAVVRDIYGPLGTGCP